MIELTEEELGIEATKLLEQLINKGLPVHEILIELSDFKASVNIVKSPPSSPSFQD